MADKEPEVTEADTVDGGIDEDPAEGAAANEESAEADADEKVEDE